MNKSTTKLALIVYTVLYSYFWFAHNHDRKLCCFNENDAKIHTVGRSRVAIATVVFAIIIL